MSILALDVGNKRVGVAYSIEGIALPYKVIPRVEIVKEIKKLISEKHISDIVIGLPYINSGLSNQALKIQEFSKKILETFPMIRLHFIDERFTSLIPKKELISQDPIDMISAQMLLETFLSRKK